MNTVAMMTRKIAKATAAFCALTLALASPALAYNLWPLDINIVTTGGVAVQALNPGHHAAGGWLQNPPTATVNLCINEHEAASGTASQGNTTCIAPGAPYYLSPNSGAVSVISSDSAHAFSGYGFSN